MQNQPRLELQSVIKHQSALTANDHQIILETAVTAYDNARIDGLCHEGAYEIALQKIQTYLSKNATTAG